MELIMGRCRPGLLGNVLWVLSLLALAMPMAAQAQYEYYETSDGAITVTAIRERGGRFLSQAQSKARSSRQSGITRSTAARV